MVEKLNFGQCYKLGKTIFDNIYQKCLVYYSIYDVNLSKIRQKRVFIKVLFLILFKKISYWWSVSGSNR